LSLLDSPKLSSVVHVSSLGLSCFHQFLNFLMSFSQLLQWLSLELIKFVGSFSQLRSPWLSFNSRLSFVSSQLVSTFFPLGLFLQLLSYVFGAVRCSKISSGVFVSNEVSSSVNKALVLALPLFLLPLFLILLAVDVVDIVLNFF
jgi:hypothetical protein